MFGMWRRVGCGLLSALTAFLGLGIIVVQAQPAAATVKPLKVFVGYADDIRANPVSFPTPWEGSAGINFIGAGPSDPGGAAWDSGGVMLQNPNSTPVTVSDVTINLNRPQSSGTGPTYDFWGSSITVPANGATILAQTSGNNLDTSDFADIEPCGTSAPATLDPPLVLVTVNGTQTTYTDSGHVLDTRGYDKACQGNESTQWTVIGKAPCAASALTLAPASTTATPGASVTMNAAFSACGTPIANQTINFAVNSGPDGPGSTAPVSGSATTNSKGVATFTYSDSANANAEGIDYVQASTSNTIGTINSNTASVTFETASLTVNPGRGLPGASINYSGSGYGANEPVKLFDYPNSSVVLASTTASSTGTIGGSLVVPVPASSKPTTAIQAVNVQVPAGRGGGIHAPSVNRVRRTARRFSPCLAAVCR
jgi:hypothetical protein